MGGERLLTPLTGLERREWEQTNCIGQRDTGGRAAPPGVPATTRLMDVMWTDGSTDRGVRDGGIVSFIE